MEAILTYIQVFNCRRAGETERILINDYKNYECACKTDTLCKTDANHEYVRFVLRGKLNSTVPVLLDAEVFKRIELLLKLRKKANVPLNNPFLFGLSGSKENGYRHLDACKLLRQFSSAYGAKNVSTLRGTALRKHIATKCVDLNLSDNQISRVVNFIGHHEQIHKKIYRQPVARVDILEMSKILEKAQGAESTTDTTANETDITMRNEGNNFSNLENYI